MAWSYSSEHPYYGGQGSTGMWETITVEQIASTTAGYIRLKITSTACAFNNSPPYYIGIIPAKSAVVTDDRTTYTSGDKKFEQRTSTGYGDWQYKTIEMDVPSSLAGKSVTISGAVGSWSGITLGAIPSYILSVTKGDNISSLTVKRTFKGSDWSTVATLSTDAIIYKGDKLSVTYTAKSGYEAKVTLNSSAIASGATHTVSGKVTISAVGNPQATVSVFNGTAWNKYLVYIYDGSSWSLYQPMIYNGTSWDKYF